MTLVLLVMVAILWGATNPFLKKGSRGVESVQHNSRIKQTFYEVLYLVKNWKVRTGFFYLIDNYIGLL